MKHIYQQGTNAEAPVLVLLHGTGGTERDLLPLAGMISPQSSVLSIRGNVLENGMPRFFKRLAEGVFDEEDLVLRTKELYDFLDEAAETYGFNRRNLVAVGYSNGANIAGSLLFHYSDALRGAILHHPMVPRRGIQLPDLSGVPVFMGAGRNDPICPPQESEDLEQLLSEAGAVVNLHWESTGHQLTGSEIDAASAWYQRTFS
ncbi:MULTISPECIES: alpha/beta hydrolase [Paenibacillus]|uniref:Phospholipase/carboxylesterase n=1 Tax=Paenibacillus vini TaxID=1476024 RepID=A0ABQ4M5V4_9BACL|nr:MULTISPECIES: alpha/beta hydrolase [Paenibacillus]MBQ4900477.1 alpha/beta hydrolase [Paenibacillus sp. Marseille-P2973]MDN4068400.1 alpha/beta hydrolase [Paenibacillus vini]GIP51379.1 phospholipase/carboxylesterase [Paenibacillus vini]